MIQHPCCPTDRPAVQGTLPELKGILSDIEIFPNKFMKLYTSHAQSSDQWIVIVYDIFGLHPNNIELADWLSSSQGLNVAVPDILGDRHWPLDLFPPIDEESKKRFNKFMQEEANPQMKTDEVKATIDYLFAHKGAKHVSLLGLCWGAKIASLIDSYMGKVKATAFAHPSLLGFDDGKEATVPTFVLPTKDDNLTLYLGGCLSNKEPSLFKVSPNYASTFHGFLGARGQWDLAEERALVNQAMEELAQFFNGI